MEIAAVEAKLAQQLVFLEQEALHSVFIDLKKAYDAMDREQPRDFGRVWGWTQHAQAA